MRERLPDGGRERGILAVEHDESIPHTLGLRDQRVLHDDARLARRGDDANVLDVLQRLNPGALSWAEVLPHEIVIAWLVAADAERGRLDREAVGGGRLAGEIRRFAPRQAPGSGRLYVGQAGAGVDGCGIVPAPHVGDRRLAPRQVLERLDRSGPDVANRDIDLDNTREGWRDRRDWNDRNGHGRRQLHHVAGLHLLHREVGPCSRPGAQSISTIAPG